MTNQNDSSDFKPVSRERVASIGASIKIKGEISGSEDLLIQGSIEGTVNLPSNMVTVGQTAKINADVAAREICVEGEVNGNLVASEKVVVRSSGRVKGNISCPCLSLEEGARLKGAIDTDASGSESGRVSVKVEETKAKRESTVRLNGVIADKTTEAIPPRI